MESMRSDTVQPPKEHVLFILPYRYDIISYTQLASLELLSSLLSQFIHALLERALVGLGLLNQSAPVRVEQGSQCCE